MGTATAQPLPAVSLRSGTVGRAASRAAIAWCDPGRAVVRASVASGRIWMVLLAYSAHRAPDVAQGVLKEVQRGMFGLACCFRGGGERKAAELTRQTQGEDPRARQVMNENGRLGHRDGAHGRGDRRRRALMLAAGRLALTVLMPYTPQSHTYTTTWEGGHEGEAHGNDRRRTHP